MRRAQMHGGMDGKSAMAIESEAEELKRLELTEIFHNTLAPIAEMPALRAVFAANADACSADLLETFSLQAGFAFVQSVQAPSGEALAPCGGRVAAIYSIAEWGARAVVAFDRQILFRALDAMYGGDGQVDAPPARDLTGLERAVAAKMAKTVMARFQTSLAPFIAFECALESLDTEFDVAVFEKDRYDLVAVQMRLGDLDEWVIVALPVRGLELARSQIAAPSEEAPVELDPNWGRYLEQNVGRTEVDVVAVAAGPPMMLREVAQLRPGSLIEFEAERLECVQIESDGEPIFEGQLGQTKGYLSVCIETPLSADAAAGGAASSRHAAA